MIKVIKYNEPYNDQNSYDLTVTIKDGMISVKYVTYFNNEETVIQLDDEPFIPYNRYVIYENGNQLKLINSTEYTAFKKSKLTYISRLTGMVDVYTIAVCDITESDKNIIFNPGSKKVKNITVISDVEVQEQNVTSIEERDNYFWIFLDDMRKCYSFTINDVLYYGNIITESSNKVYSISDIESKESEIIDLTSLDNDYIDIHIQKYSYNNKEISNLDTDKDEVEITTTGGVLNTSIVNLQNGQGTVRLYPMGYKGEFVISIGMIFNGSNYKLKL